MSIFSALRALFGNSRSGQNSSQAPRPAQPAPPSPSVPPVSKPAAKPKPPQIVPASTDQSRVTGPRDTAGVKPGLKCDFLTIKNGSLKSISDDFEVRHQLDLSGCRQLTRLPDGIRTSSVRLKDCTSLEELPSDWKVSFLDLEGCVALRALPADLRLLGGTLNLKGCKALRDLPPDLGSVAGLNLAGCTGITQLPTGLQVTSWIDIGGTGIRTLPPGFDHVGLRQNGKVISLQDL